MTIDTHEQTPPKVSKVIKRHGSSIALVKLDEPIYGGQYAIVSSCKMTTGLNLDAANDLFRTLKMLTR